MNNLLPTPKMASEINRVRAALSTADEEGFELAGLKAGVSSRTVRRWAEKKAGGLPVCDRRHFNRGRPSRIDDMRLGWALAFMASRRKAPVSVVCRELNKVADREGWPTTHYRALGRALERLAPDVRVLLAEGARATFEKTSLVGQRTQSRPLELVQMDASEMEIWTINPATGEMVKPWISGIIDGFSRVIMGFTLHFGDPSAMDAARAVHTAFLPKGDATWPFFGLPEKLQTDNAQAYIGKLLTGIACRAGFILDQVPLSCPSANGKIERFFRTFHDGLLSRLAGFAGQYNGKGSGEKHGVIPFEVLKSVARKFLFEYHSTVHSGIGTTPWEAWHNGLVNVPGYQMPPAMVRQALRVDMECEVGRDGVLVLGTRYSGNALQGLVGRKVTVLCSPFGGDDSVEAYYLGQPIGKLLPHSNNLADEINAGRLERNLALAATRSKLAASLDQCPPVDAPVTVIPKEEKKRIKAANARPRKKGKIRQVSVEVESDSSGNPATLTPEPNVPAKRPSVSLNLEE